MRVLLERGFVVDGSGSPGYLADVLIEDDQILEIARRSPESSTDSGSIKADRKIDCEGLVVAPGFIDLHSHNDWFVDRPDRAEFHAPFTAQGVTTFVTGNCGFGAAGFRPATPHARLIVDNIFSGGRDGLDDAAPGQGALPWYSMSEYFDCLESRGLSHNVLTLAGHGTTRTSLRGFDPSPLRPDEEREMLYLLEQALDEGAGGLSLGLQYEPGIFATRDEIDAVARLARSRDRLLTVHAKAYSSISGTYPLRPFGQAHNLIAIQDMLDVARRTGVRLQFSHLNFVGSRTWRTVDRALELFDRAVADGVDVCFDIFAHNCGASIVNVVLPEWFLARMPGVLDDRRALMRLRAEIFLMSKLLGFGYDEIQIAHGNHPDLCDCHGMTTTEIAKFRNLSKFDNFADLIRESGGRARVLMHRHNNLELTDRLMRHSASLFMTDAWIEPEGLQNPAAFGTYPNFLERTRKRGVLSLEGAIRKMTGGCADRVGIRDRGYLRPGLAADITVFDLDRVQDNTTRRYTDRKPSGIEHVFLNGFQILQSGRVFDDARAGRLLFP
jgi:N-acyl-D-amino-acid deacylase